MTGIEEDQPEDKLAEERIRGEQAREVLENPMLVATLDGMESVLFDAFKQCPPSDQTGLQGIHAQAVAVEAFKKNLKTVLQTGQMAEMQIRAMQEEDDKALKGVA